MSDEAIYEERARNKSVRAMLQDMRRLERERDEARAVARKMKRERDMWESRALDFEDAIHESYYEMVPLEWAYVDPFTALEGMLRHHRDCAANWADALTEIVKLKAERDLWKSTADGWLATAVRLAKGLIRRPAPYHDDVGRKYHKLAHDVLKAQRAGRGKPAKGE